MKTYYGEYTLGHWIDLLLNENIVVPDFQRRFVWQLSDVNKLFETIKTGGYIPPVTIGSFRNKDGKDVNYIVDGQQRLTSLLLIHYNIFPKKISSDKVNNKEIKEVYSSNDLENYIEPEIKDITDNFCSYSSIISIIANNKDKDKGFFQKEFPISNDENIIFAKLNKNDCDSTERLKGDSYLGFVYIVDKSIEANPESENRNETINSSQEVFSDIFSHLNSSGVRLNAQESRRAYYFIDEKYKEFFDCSEIKDFTIEVKSEKNYRYPDFIRYMSFLSHFHKLLKDNQNLTKTEIANAINEELKNTYIINRKFDIEKYYTDYLKQTIKLKDLNCVFYKVDDLFNEKKSTNENEIKKAIKYRLDKITTVTKEYLKDQTHFNSIIECDLFLFGMIYKYIFLNKFSDNEREFVIKIKEDIKSISKNEKPFNDNNYKRSPNIPRKKILERLVKSLELWGL